MRFGTQSHSFSHLRSCGSTLHHLISKSWSNVIRNSGNDASNIHWTDLIRKHTIISRDHLTPEIQLHLITPDCKLWSEDERKSPFEDPFWAFYWPGGQALARYILDNPSEVQGKTVVDIGCGSGACSIAAAMSRAEAVIANDTDEIACIATMLNAELNGVAIKIESANIIGQDIPWDCILIGDMFYDDEFADLLFSWLKSLHREGKKVLIGDAGRLALKNIRTREHLKSRAIIQLPDNVRTENNGFTTAEIWSL